MIPLAVELVITSPLSLARVLWWYGEDQRWHDLSWWRSSGSSGSEPGHRRTGRRPGGYRGSAAAMPRGEETGTGGQLDSRERFREFTVRVRSRFAISAAAGFMNLIHP